jgi:hypothetical protein
MKLIYIIIGALISFTFCSTYEIEEPLLLEKFPDDFEWGVATASYQVQKKSVF